MQSDPSGNMGELSAGELIQSLIISGGLGAIDGPLPIADVAALLVLASLCLSQTKIVSNSVSNTRSSNSENYWKADLLKGNVVIGEPLGFVQACLWVALGKSVMCKDEESAQSIIKINRYRNAIGPEIHGEEGFFWHYHPTRNHTGHKSVHIWFYR